MILDSEQSLLQVDVPQMLEDEVAWLSNFVPSEHHELKETDNSLLAGHLKLIKTLFTCDGVSKEEHGTYSQSLCTLFTLCCHLQI